MLNKEETVQKLKDAGIFGKGGAAFPTWQKWEGCGNAEGDLKYIICNSSEGELGVFKDLYVWRNHMDMVFKGIQYAMDFLGNSEVYIHINRDYYNELHPQLYKYINDFKWEHVFHVNIEENCYVGGEASALMNIIETGIAQPKSRTTRTVIKGLFQMPTLMQNVETFYDIARTLDGTYDNKRFSGIFGNGIEKKFVVRHDIDATIEDIFKENSINPNFDFYVQIGGSASGMVIDKTQLKDYKMIGVGSIEIFDKSKRGFLKFLQRIVKFYQKESCGKCFGKKFATSLDDLVKTFNTDEDAITKIDEMLVIINDMNKKTFCKLCKSLKTPFVSYCKNVLHKQIEEK